MTNHPTITLEDLKKYTCISRRVQNAHLGAMGANIFEVYKDSDGKLFTYFIENGGASAREFKPEHLTIGERSYDQSGVERQEQVELPCACGAPQCNGVAIVSTDPVSLKAHANLYAPSEPAPEVREAQEVTLTSEELQLLETTLEQFEDDGETDTPYETLMRWANLGFLECTHFESNGKTRALIAETAAPLFTTAQAAKESPTTGMTLGELVAHVGGVVTDTLHVHFGSMMAVSALVRQVLRDLPATLTKDVPESGDFIVRTNKAYAAWCATIYTPASLDARWMKSLDGLWAWQEQERRLLAKDVLASAESVNAELVALPEGWVAIPLEPSEAEWTYAQGTLLDAGWDATTCLAARIQTLIAITRDLWKAALASAKEEARLAALKEADNG